MNGEEYEVDEEEVEECEEEEQSPGESVIDQACFGTEKLSLLEREDEKGEKGNEDKEEEEEEDDHKTPQGTRFCHVSYLSNCKRVAGECKC